MKKIHKKIFAIILVFSMLLIASPSPARADFWGASMMSAIWKQTTEQMVKSIQDTIVANLKTAAIRIIQARLFSLLGNQKGVSTPGVTDYIISDWKMFIYSSANRYSDLMVNDFFDSMNARATVAVRKNILNPAQKAANEAFTNMTPDLQYYCPDGDASKAFDKSTRNSWMCWFAAAQPQNDLAFTYLRASSIRQAAYEQEVMARQSEGIAGQGVKSKETKQSTNQKPFTATTSQGGKVTVPPGSDYTGVAKITAPGAIIKDLMSQVQSMPINMLTAAQNIPQIATAMVNQMITQVIQQGATNIAEGKNAGSQNMSQQMNAQMQNMIQNGVREMASPRTFFGR